MHRSGERPAHRIAAVVAALTLLATGSACSTGRADAVDQAAVERLTRVLDLELAGREVPTRGILEALVLGAHPAVAAGLDGVFAPGNLEYAVYRGTGQSVPESAPVAVAVWDRDVGGGPFVDDGGAWHLTCAQLSVDRASARVRGAVVRCPDRLPERPPTPAVDAPAPVLGHEAPVEGRLVTGEAADTGAATGALLPLTPARATAACTADLLAGTLEALSTTIGATDSAAVRVVNTGGVPCVLAGPVRLGLRQSGVDVPVVSAGPEGSAVVLAPRESAVATVSWQPSERVDGDVPQRLTLGPDDVALRPGAGLPVAPVPVDPGATLRLTAWRVLGYGASLDDAPRPVDVAAPCVADDLGVMAPQRAASSGTVAPPSIDVLNLGVLACSLRPGLPGSAVVDGVPALREGPLVVLRPGDRVSLLTESEAPSRPGELLVKGQWVRVTASSGP